MPKQITYQNWRHINAKYAKTRAAEKVRRKFTSSFSFCAESSLFVRKHPGKQNTQLALQIWNWYTDGTIHACLSIAQKLPETNIKTKSITMKDAGMKLLCLKNVTPTLQKVEYTKFHLARLNKTTAPERSTSDKNLFSDFHDRTGWLVTINKLNHTKKNRRRQDIKDLLEQLFIKKNCWTISKEIFYNTTVAYVNLFLD